MKKTLMILLFLAAAASAKSRRYSRIVFPQSDSLPNPSLTPGAINPNVTQGNIHQTICRDDYARSIRPEEGYTERLKRQGIRQYGYAQQVGRAGYRLSNYEEDHLVPLELGGSPDSPQNLWPEPHNVVGGWGSYTKDKLEDRMRDLVCRGEVPLAQAQREIATDWVAAYERYMR